MHEIKLEKLKKQRKYTVDAPNSIMYETSPNLVKNTEEI